MRVFSLCALLCLLAPEVFGTTRAPSSVGENSLLYWRYLCRDQPQHEKISKGSIELSCLNQHWSVKANARDGRVGEVVQDDAR